MKDYLVVVSHSTYEGTTTVYKIKAESIVEVKMHCLLNHAEESSEEDLKYLDEIDNDPSDSKIVELFDYFFTPSKGSQKNWEYPDWSKILILDLDSIEEISLEISK
jgi:hypothetical protein